jgi:hypothetical protein
VKTTENQSRRWNINFKTEEIPDAKRQLAVSMASFKRKSSAITLFSFYIDV